jgi:dipeptidyl aminopeptidase/acylaminoacyl peptidase
VVPLTTYDVAENKGSTDLWMVPVAGGAARQLTSDKASDTQATVSPDGKWVAFVSKRGDDTESQVYVIATDGGEARRVTQVPTGASVPKWFPDSKRLAFVSDVWPDLVRWEDQAARNKERESSKMTARVWTQAPISYFDHFLDERQPHLFSIALEGGETHGDHSACPATGCRRPRSTRIPTTSRRTASRWHSAPTSTAADRP